MTEARFRGDERLYVLLCSMAHEPIVIETDVLVIGSGAAGMYAAIEAARARRARPPRRPQPDRPRRRHRDGADDGGRGARRGGARRLAASLRRHHRRRPRPVRRNDWRGCSARTRRTASASSTRWGVGWARKDGHIAATTAPGHDRPRCVYVDFINTGPAVSKTLRTVDRAQPKYPQNRRPLHRRSGRDGEIGR